MVERIVTVTTSSTKLLDIQPSRKEYTIQNQGAITVYLSYSPNVTITGTTTGRILAAGGMESVSILDQPVIVTKELHAVVSVGSANVWVYEAT